MKEICEICGHQMMSVKGKSYCPYCGGINENLTQTPPSVDVAERNAETASAAHENLLNNLNGSMDYCVQRGIPVSVINHWQLGYLPKYNDYLTYMWDDRLIFPIKSNDNQFVIGFGGRIIRQEDRAKYINSRGSEYYNKSISLYGYNLVTQNAKRVYLCEGYMDAISMVSHGHKNTVASLGTALTPSQARLLKQKTDSVYICYDTDAPGELATTRAVRRLLQAGFTPDNIGVVKPREAKDVDEALTKGSAIDVMPVARYLAKKHNYELLADIAIEMEA